MLWMRRLKIDVAGQIVGEKPQAQFKGDEADAVKDKIIIARGKKPTGLGKIALENGPAEADVKADMIKVSGLFPRGLQPERRQSPRS